MERVWGVSGKPGGGVEGGALGRAVVGEGVNGERACDFYGGVEEESGE